MKECIAVIDIGKTNKKVLVFDESLKIIDSVYKSFEEYVEKDIHYEVIEPVTEWLFEQLGHFAKKYSLKAISISTHGATAFCVDDKGKLATPAVAYTTEASPEFRKEFYDQFGSPAELQKLTATAEVGSLINIAKKIFFIQQTFPEQYHKVAHILNYPQYLGYLLTNNIGAEPTFVGCHTYMMDFQKKSWSPMVDKLGIRNKLPQEIRRSWDVLGTVTPDIAKKTGLSQSCIVTMGIHDSNSSLLPYLIKGYGNFVLNSTGTWCVAMHPTDSVHFQADEIGKMVFYNMDVFFNPVKTSIFMGGLEFETWVRLFMQFNNRNDYPEFDPGVYKKIISDKSNFIFPSVVKGTGLFPTSVARVVEGDREYSLESINNGASIPAFFSNYSEAFAVINLSLAIQTRIALKTAGFDGNGSIFTEGGFRHNKGYNAVLASIHPNAKTALTKLSEATAFGAAILAKAALDKTSPDATKDLFEIEILPVDPIIRSAELDEYVREYERRMRNEE